MKKEIEDIESNYFIDRGTLREEEDLYNEQARLDARFRPEVTYRTKDINMELSYKYFIKIIDNQIRKGLINDLEFKNLKSLKEEMYTTMSEKDYIIFLIEMSAYFVCLSERLDKEVYRYLPNFTSPKIELEQVAKVIENVKNLALNEYLHSSLVSRLKDLYLNDGNVTFNAKKNCEQTLLNQFTYYKYVSIFFKDMSINSSLFHYDMYEYYNEDWESAEIVDDYFNFFISTYSEVYGEEIIENNLF